MRIISLLVALYLMFIVLGYIFDLLKLAAPVLKYVFLIVIPLLIYIAKTNRATKSTAPNNTAFIAFLSLLVSGFFWWIEPNKKAPETSGETIVATKQVDVKPGKYDNNNPQTSNLQKSQTVCEKLDLLRGELEELLDKEIQKEDTPQSKAKTIGLYNETMAALAENKCDNNGIDNKSASSNADTSNSASLAQNADPLRELNSMLHCQVTYVSGLKQVYITAKDETGTYAINGTARALGAQRGWIDGYRKFTPEQMKILLQIGLNKCK